MPSPTTPAGTARPTSATEAFAALRAGNERFAQNLRSVDAIATQARREELTAGQSPFAIVLSCSDSRAPSEILFDVGLGDLFVVRVAGNVCAPSLVGSVEFAAATFGTELVVVMGHTRCGAISATLDALTKPTPSLTDNIADIVSRIAPAVRELASLDRPREQLVRDATRANIRASTNQLRHGSRLLEERIAKGKLVVVGAEYALETGKVEFFDLPPGFKS